MAITTLDGLIGSNKVIRLGSKTTTLTTVAGGWFSPFAVAGALSGVLAGGETTPPATTVGRVTTDSIPGYPDIPWSSLRTYLSRLTALNTVTSTLRVFDSLWCGGTYAFNASVATVSGSYASRVSYNGGSADYAGLELWLEQVTAGTLVQNVAVTYTNQSGTTGKSTGTVACPAAMAIARCHQLPLAVGDSGLQGIGNGASPSVVGSVASAGTFNLRILRPICDIYLPANAPVTFNWGDLGLPEIFNDSALFFLLNAPSGTSSGTLAPLSLQFSNG
jgi:hypothetical protein